MVLLNFLREAKLAILLGLLGGLTMDSLASICLNPSQEINEPGEFAMQLRYSSGPFQAMPRIIFLQVPSDELPEMAEPFSIEEGRSNLLGEPLYAELEAL